MKTVKVDKEIKISDYLQSPDASVKKTVAKIIADVKKDGDKALLGYTEKLDGVNLLDDGIKVPPGEIEEACKKVEKSFIGALGEAKKNIEKFHVEQVASSWLKTDVQEMVGQLVGPVENVGLYVPGGQNGYPSTLLMNVIPAQAAGVRRIAVVSPPSKDKSVSPYTLTAAYECGVDEVYAVGGAQAIAALAYGTETIQKVDVITGPGNIYVSEAKRQVFGDVGIDMVAGPSEIVIMADIKSDPNLVAADLLSQAEHDAEARAILITDSEVLAKKVEQNLDVKLKSLNRKDIAKKSLDDKGLIFITDGINTSIEIANEIAPEHLVVLVEQPTKWLPLIKNAGAIYLGPDAVQSAGDYSIGPNHVLPTGGRARFASPLSVSVFQKRSNLVWLGSDALKKYASVAAAIAKVEGFDGHLQAIEERLKDK